MKRADAYGMYLAGLINENAYLAEAMVGDEGLQGLIREYKGLVEELQGLKARLEEMEARKKELAAEIAPVLEAIDETEERTLQVDDIVVSIDRTGSTQSRYKYEQVCSGLLKEVNDEVKEIILRLKEAAKYSVTVATTLKVQTVEHGILSTLARIWGQVVDFIGLSNHKIDRAIQRFRSEVSL